MRKEDPHYKEMYKLLKSSIKPREDKNILVMGCHAWRDVDVLLYQNPMVRITILEPVKSFYDKYNERRGDKLWKGHVTVVHAPWEKQYPFSRMFDTVVCLDCIEHSPYPNEVMRSLSEYSDKIILSCPNGFWNFRDGLRHEDHGHGPHIQRFSFWDIYKMFDKIGYHTCKSTPVRYRLLGWFGFGIFAIGGAKARILMESE